MKKNDLFLGILILFIAVSLFFLYREIRKQEAAIVTVTVDGKLYGTYSLKKDREVQINETNTLIIRGGYADMTEADCPDGICVNHKPISKNGETIVCLPNKVIVEIVGGENLTMDAVSN